MVETSKMTVETVIKTEPLFKEPFSNTLHYYELSSEVGEDNNFMFPVLIRVDEKERLLSEFRHHLMNVIDSFLNKNILTSKEHYKFLQESIFEEEYQAVLSLLQKGKSLNLF